MVEQQQHIKADSGLGHPQIGKDCEEDQIKLAWTAALLLIVECE